MIIRGRSPFFRSTDFDTYARTTVQRRANGEKYRASLESKEVPEIYRNKKRRVEKPHKLPTAKVITVSYWGRIVKWFKCFRKV